MDAKTKVAVKRTLDGDYRWELVQRVSLFRRNMLAASDHQFLTREGAFSEGSRALRGLIQARDPRAERHLRLVHSANSQPARNPYRDTLNAPGVEESKSVPNVTVKVRVPAV